MKNILLTLVGTTSLLFTLSATALNAAPLGMGQGQGLGQGVAKQNKQAPAKPFLIQGKLPHLSMMVKVLWDDEDLALTQGQKKQLLAIRQETMKTAKELGGKINPLEDEIVKLSFDGAKPKDLKAKVERLASLRAEATMVHLACIYKTKAILTKEQLEIIE
jgi:Spy/CpxP family protein refolding chaperone